jgi:hypothetical protein
MSDKPNLEAAFEELETGQATSAIEEREEVAEKVDYAKELKEELNELTAKNNGDEVDDEITLQVDEMPAEDCSEEEHQHDNDDDEDEKTTEEKLQDQTRENAKLLKTVKEYDAYIKQLIYMVDTLGARLKQFGLEHYF